MSHRICVDLDYELIKLRPDWASAPDDDIEAEKKQSTVVLTGGQETALVKKLSFLSGASGVKSVQAFINQVSGLANAGVLTRKQADDLIASAVSILASLQ